MRQQKYTTMDPHFFVPVADLELIDGQTAKIVVNACDDAKAAGFSEDDNCSETAAQTIRLADLTAPTGWPGIEAVMVPDGFDGKPQQGQIVVKVKSAAADLQADIAGFQFYHFNGSELHEIGNCPVAGKAFWEADARSCQLTQLDALRTYVIYGKAYDQTGNLSDDLIPIESHIFTAQTADRTAPVFSSGELKVESGVSRTLEWPQALDNQFDDRENVTYSIFLKADKPIKPEILDRYEDLLANKDVRQVGVTDSLRHRIPVAGMEGKVFLTVCAGGGTTIRSSNNKRFFKLYSDLYFKEPVSASPISGWEGVLLYNHIDGVRVGDSNRHALFNLKQGRKPLFWQGALKNFDSKGLETSYHNPFKVGNWSGRELRLENLNVEGLNHVCNMASWQYPCALFGMASWQPTVINVSVQGKVHCTIERYSAIYRLSETSRNIRLDLEVLGGRFQIAEHLEGRAQDIQATISGDASSVTLFHFTADHAVKDITVDLLNLKVSRTCLKNTFST